MSVFRKLNYSKLIGCIVFLLVGCIALTAGIMMFRSDRNFKSNAKQIEGSITDIQVFKNSDGSTSHSVYVAFTLNGIEYEGKINEYSSDMYIGKEIFVFYNIDNPTDFRTCNPLFYRVLILCGLLFLVIGISPWIFKMLKNAAMKRFSQNHEIYSKRHRHTPKDKMLADAVFVLNDSNQPWLVRVEDNNIIAYWKWKKAGELGKALNHYMFSVTLNDSGWWWEDMDTMVTTSNFEINSVYGKTYQKSFEFSFDRDKESGKLKLNKGLSTDTKMIKRAIRSYLKDNGWKRAGLLSKL